MKKKEGRVAFANSAALRTGREMLLSKKYSTKYMYLKCRLLNIMIDWAGSRKYCAYRKRERDLHDLLLGSTVQTNNSQKKTSLVIAW